MSVVLDFATTLSSTVAATGILYIAREARSARKQIEVNRDRSRRNAAALVEQGFRDQLRDWKGRNNG